MEAVVAKLLQHKQRQQRPSAERDIEDAVRIKPLHRAHQYQRVDEKLKHLVAAAQVDVGQQPRPRVALRAPLAAQIEPFEQNSQKEQGRGHEQDDLFAVDQRPVDLLQPRMV